MGRACVLAVVSDRLLGENHSIDRRQVQLWISWAAALRQEGRRPILVSCRSHLDCVGAQLPRRRGEHDAPQALATIGQSKIAAAWLDGFAEVGQLCAQVLLDNEDLGIPERRLATAKTLETLLAQGVIPVISENESAKSADMVRDPGVALAVSVAELLQADLIGEND